jgi:peptidoglycan/LPS O-acetylase OafA/YrhL
MKNRGCVQLLQRRVFNIYVEFLPSFIRSHLDGPSSEVGKIHPTSYLDGFRGVMCFLVFVRHFFLPWIPELDHGFKQGLDNSHILQLPVLRILYSGPNVPVFLVVSGYVMSLKPTKLARNGRLEKLSLSVASSIFRRAVRLFTPPLVSTLIVMIMVQLNFFSFLYTSMPGSVPIHPQKYSSIFAQFLDWVQFVFMDLTNPWNWRTPPLLYGAHLWTIPLQFRSSMVLFLTIMGLSRLRPAARAALLALLPTFCVAHGRWDVALYLSGMALAEYDCQSEKTEPSILPLKTLLRPKTFSTRLLFRTTWILVFVLALYLASFPRFKDGVGAPGYQSLYMITSNYRFWHSYGAVLAMWCLGRSRRFQSLFTFRFTRYLGKISFSLYIVHEPLLHVIGFRIVDLMWRLTGRETKSQSQLGLAISFCLVTPMLIWVADLFHYHIDRRCGNLAVWMEKRWI